MSWGSISVSKKSSVFGPIHSSFQWVPEALSPETGVGVQRPKREASQSLLPSVDIKNV